MHNIKEIKDTKTLASSGFHIFLHDITPALDEGENHRIYIFQMTGFYKYNSFFIEP